MDDIVNNETIQYNYDNKGNIPQRTYHAYTTSTPDTATRTDTWTYGDQLIMQTSGNTSLFFLYDANRLIGFDHIVSGTTQATYYYQIDGNGEIIGITDTAGNI